MSEYKKLLEPIKIGTHTWKNRIVKGPSATMYAGPNQFSNNVLIGSYEAMAKGGAAAVIVGAMVSDDPKMLIENETDENYPYGYQGYPFLGLYDDKFINPLKKLTGAMHAHGCEIIAQIFQNGSILKTKGGSWGPSTLSAEELPSPVPLCNPTRELSIREIHEFEQRYIDAAERAQKAGFDGVEVHAANGYLILSFVSRVWNYRHDEYGCDSIENRTRLACELISGIRERCGKDFIVGVRTNGQEFCHPNAITLDEGVEIAKRFDAAGVDYISVTGYGYGATPFQYSIDYWQSPEADPNMVQFLPRLKDGLVIEPAAKIKEQVKAPVFSIGSLDVDKAERLIEEGKIDLGLMARGLWADPDIANKLAEGRPQDIRKCTHCATCDMGGVDKFKVCRVNPALGREKQLTPKPTKKQKRIVVVGGGAAGLEAARVAAQRGHDVRLFEAESKLALEMKLATMVKGTDCEDVPALYNWLISQAEKQKNLSIRKGVRLGAADIAKMQPDAVIVATGGTYPVPDIPGIDNKIVKTVPQFTKLAKKPLEMLGPEKLSALTKIMLPTVGKNCVVLGAQIEAIQGAIFLRDRGRKVTILEDTDDVGLRMPRRYKARDLKWLQEHQVEIITGVRYDHIDDRGIIYEKNGELKRLDAKTIMVFKSPVENLSLATALEPLVPKVYAVGSCKGVDSSLMVDALRTAREVACKV